MYYLETSAAAKLVLAERGSSALHRWVASREGVLFSSDLLRTELLRLARRGAPGHVIQARAVLDSLLLLELRTEVCERAALFGPASIRSLDALHLAAAMDIEDALEGIVTYDDRLAEAAELNGITVVGPR